MKNFINKLAILFLLVIVAMSGFAQDGEVESKQAILKTIWAFIQENGWWIATALLAISEGLASSKLKANSIYQLLTNWLKKKADKPQNK